MAATDDPDVADDAAVSAFQSSPDRTVFTENGNPDGWISTNYTVTVEE